MQLAFKRRHHYVGNELPGQVHAILTEEEIGEGKIIVIGDIHGCNRELQDLLEKSASQKCSSVMLFLSRHLSIASAIPPANVLLPSATYPYQKLTQYDALLLVKNRKRLTEVSEA